MFRRSPCPQTRLQCQVRSCSLNVMLPEIVPATLELTDAVKVTVWPKVERFNKDERVVVVAAVFTGCVVATELAR